jgi:hypothetical protein
MKENGEFTVAAPEGVNFYSLQFNFTGSSKGVVSGIACNMTETETYPEMDLAVKIMDADGDAAVGGSIHIDAAPVGTVPLAQNEVVQTAQASSVSIEEAPMMMAMAAPMSAEMASASVQLVGHLVIETPEAAVASGDALSFDLHLRIAQGQEMTAGEAIKVSFKVDNDAHDFSVPDELLGKEQQDANGNVLVWTKGADGIYILTAVLAPGQTLVNISFEAFHTQDNPYVVDPNQTLHLTLQGITDTDGVPLTNLDSAIHSEDDGPSLHPGDHVEFTIVDEAFANIDPLHGITHEEALGKEIVYVTGSEEGGLHNGNEVDYENGQIIIGADGDNIIYVSQGNDILVGGNGSDTFVWNNDNMGQGEQSLDVIKDFSRGDSLRFDDLMADHGDGAEAALNNLLSGGSGTSTWETNDQGGTFHATDGSTSIQLSVADTVATLTVSYEHGGQSYTQNVELQNFDISQFQQESVLDHAAVTEMLKEIIQVGGST